MNEEEENMDLSDEEQRDPVHFTGEQVNQMSSK